MSKDCINLKQREKMNKVYELFLSRVKKELHIFLIVGILGIVGFGAISFLTSSVLLGFLTLFVTYGSYILITYLRVKTLIAAGAANQAFSLAKKANEIRKNGL